MTTHGYQLLASGLAAVWARENTREGIFNAMQKKEIYATTGTRITVRFFGPSTVFNVVSIYQAVMMRCQAKCF